MKLICPDCGSQYDTGKFCMQCGGKLQEVVPELVCPSCGYKAKSGKFCPECGTKLTEQFASPTTVQSDQSVERKFNEKDERFAKYYGKKGFPRTIPQEERAIAIEELTPYAEQNIAEAQMLLGGILMESKDHDSQMKGIELIKTAEKGGDKLAYYLRAFGFLYGAGAKQDYDEAEKRMLECYHDYGEEAASNLAELYSSFPEKSDYKKAFEYATIAAENDDKDGYQTLGYLYLNGFGVKKDYNLALDNYKMAAALGDETSLNQIGIIYMGSDDFESNPEQTFYWFKEAAKKGDDMGLYNLGYCYKNGIGVTEDNEKAAECFKKAAELGNADAMCELGGYYRFVLFDPSKAKMWYQKAADLGHVDAINELGDCYAVGFGVAEDAEKAVEYYQKAADLGHVDAMYNLGNCYANGNGVAEDAEKAVEYYKKAADLGHVNAMYNLGNCYANGNGVAEDAEKAVEYYKKAADLGKIDALLGVGVICENKGDFADAVTYYTQAAEKGVPYAYLNLGKCYLEGKGFTQDLAKAEELINKAEELGVEASEIKEELLDRQEGEQNTYANALLSEGKNDEALAIYKKLAENGNVIGQSNYGNCLLNGWGTQQNMSEGIMWLEKAANQNNAWSCLRLAEVYLGLDYNDNSVTPDQEKVKEYLDKALKNGADKEEVNHIESMSIPSVEISNLVVNKDTVQNGILGIQVVFNMEATAVKGHKLSISAYCFHHWSNIEELSKPAQSDYNPYCCTYVEIVEPPYFQTGWDQCQIFIPYSRILTVKASLEETLIIMVWDITNQKSKLLACEELPYQISYITHTFRSNEWNFMLLPSDPSKKLIKIPIKGKQRN